MATDMGNGERDARESEKAREEQGEETRNIGLPRRARARQRNPDIKKMGLRCKRGKKNDGPHLCGVVFLAPENEKRVERARRAYSF